MSDSRLEKFIYAICSMDVSDLPVPLSRIEKLWNCLITGETPDFEPLSRNEKYLMAMLDRYDISNLPAPMSRGEKLLYKIAVGETDLSDVPGYLSRYEELLKYLIENGGISGGDFEYVLYTLNQSLYTLYTTAEKPVKSAILKGQTLVNIFDNSLLYGFNYCTINSDGSLTMNAIGRYTECNFKLSSYIGKKVTIFIIFDENTIDVESYNLQFPIFGHKNFTRKEDRYLKKYVGVVEDGYLRFGLKADVTSGSIKFKFMVIEGDFLNQDIPYFTGMQSVKLPVLTTTGKNLMSSSLRYDVFLENDGLESTIYQDIVSKEFIQVESSTSYGIATFYQGEIMEPQNIFICEYDNGKNFIQRFNATLYGVFATDINTKYIKFSIGGSGIPGDIEERKKILIELEKTNIKPTAYEPYKSNILSCLEPVELGSVGEVKDELNLLTQQLTQRTETRPYQEGDELNSEFVTDMTNTRYKLAQEVVKTVDLTTVDQDNQPTQLGTFENITHVSLESAGLIPEVEMEVATNLLEDTVFNLTDAFNTLYPTSAKPVVDGTLYGQTLVNLSSEKTKTGANNLNIMVNYLKPNTQYTVFFNYISDNPVTGRCSLGNKIGVNNTIFVGENGLKKVLVTTPELTSTDYRLFIYTNNNDAYTVDEVMVIEGKHTNIYIPYFEGMQSVQAPGITMVGKNLFDKTTVKYNTTIQTYEDGEEQTDNRYMVSDFIEVEPNTNYISNHMGVIFYYNRNKKIVGSLNNNTLPQQFMTPNDCKYIRIRCWNLYDTIEKQKEIVELEQLEKGSVVTEYEPYKSITLSTPSDLTLRKVGDVQDEVNVMTGEVVERIGEMVLDGSEDEIWFSEFENDTTFGMHLNINNSITQDIVICDKIKSSGRDIFGTNIEGVYINKIHNLQLNILKNKLSTLDENGFRQWLSQNPITIQYKLATPTTKTVDLTVVNQDGNETKLKTFDDTTHVLLQSEGLVPTASLTVRTKIPSASSTSLLMDDISNNQQELEATVDEQSNNVDATMVATTEIFEETL